MTVPEPIVMGCIPWNVADSETVVVECIETGARGGAAVAGDDDVEEEEDAIRCRWVDVVPAGGGLRYVDELNEAILKILDFR